MENYDDILETKAKKQPAFNKDEWVAQKKKERQMVFDMVNDAAVGLMQSQDKLRDYLEVQARFQHYSVSNAILVAVQKPRATRLEKFEEWKNENITINKGEKAILILAAGKEFTKKDGSVGVDYTVERYFDVSQTNFKGKAPGVVKRDEKLLLTALVSDSPCDINTYDGKPTDLPVEYVHAERKIMVKRGLKMPELFQDLAIELAHSILAEKKSSYMRSDNAFYAKAAAYIVCVRYGIEPPQIEDPDGIVPEYPKESKLALNKVRTVANQVSASIDRYFDEPAQDKPVQRT